MMNRRILLDTCFLISLVDDSRTHHKKAVEFYKYFIENKIDMELSSIVTSEFCTKQELTDLDLRNFRMLSYNVPDTIHQAYLFQDIFVNRPEGTCRVAVKDDLKLTAQCNFNKIDYFITEDDKFYQTLQKLKSTGKILFTPIYLPDGVHKAFSLPLNLFVEE